jgi:hypothetical protein
MDVVPVASLRARRLLDSEYAALSEQPTTSPQSAATPVTTTASVAAPVMRTATIITGAKTAISIIAQTSNHAL